MNFLTQKRSNTLLKKEGQPRISNSLTSDDFYYKEIANLTGSGGWKIDFTNKTTFLDPAARKILKTPKDYTATPFKLLEFYHEKDRKEVVDVYTSCKNGIPFNTTSKMVDCQGNSFWARGIGKPIFDLDGNLTSVQGVFQDITEEIENEKKLRATLKTVASRNERLMNFTNMVTHNVRSRASNLQLTLELLKDSKSEEERLELNSSLNYISESLNETISHLNEIVSIQNKALSDKEVLSFKDFMLRSKMGLMEEISKQDVEIFSEFSEVPRIRYNPEFLENIFTSLLAFLIRSNTAKEHLVIDTFSYKENKHKFLIIKDNGKSYEDNGASLFNIDKCPEDIDNKTRIHLYIVKNQIEAMNGSITVASSPGKGTTFKIRF